MSAANVARRPRLVRTVAEAAQDLGISMVTARRRVSSGTLPAIRVGGTWRVPIEGAPGLGALRPWCTVAEVANSLDVSIVTVRRWIRDGDVPAEMRGRRWRIPRAYLERLLVTKVSAASRGAGPARRRRPG
jgi:excisionase family DNA binding protein